MTWRLAAIAAIAVIAVTLGAASTATAQDSPWSLDAGIGWDNGISGHINSSGIGSINNQVVVITSNTYEEVYGTGLHLRFGGGYMVNENTEVTGTFTFQSLDADQVTPMGDIGPSNLYAQYTDYQTFGLDVGLRRYTSLNSSIRAYGEGLIGLGFIDKTDVTLVAPGANLAGEVTDFYDQTTAWTIGFNVGMIFQGSGRVGYYGQLGLRYLSGLAEVDDLVGTGLEDINDKSSRWTLPFVAGIRVRF
jgi:hypothetical protein